MPKPTHNISWTMQREWIDRQMREESQRTSLTFGSCIYTRWLLSVSVDCQVVELDLNSIDSEARLKSEEKRDKSDLEDGYELN